MIDNDFNEPLWNIKYYLNLNKKIENETGDFLNKNTNNPKLYSNDIRHQYASALYDRNKGYKAAKTLGDLNEFFDFSGSGREDTDIDQINNEIGREYGEKYPNLIRNELLYMLLTNWNDNLRRRNEKMQQKGYKNYGN